MNHQLHEDRGAIENLPRRQMSKTLLQMRLEPDELEELLNDDQAGK